MIIRASMVGKLMASPDKDKMPAQAITACNEIISQHVLNWKPKLDMYAVKKGIQCEDESIDLLGQYDDEFYVKNVERVTKGHLTGECDINHNGTIIDIKTAYSRATMHLNLKASSLYEWQLRAYMYLYDVSSARLVYCLVDTPPDLIKANDDPDWHTVGELPLYLRVADVAIERDLELENLMLKRIDLCGQYIMDGIDYHLNQRAKA